MVKLPPPNKDGRLPGENGDAVFAKRKKNAGSKRADVARKKAEILRLYESGHTIADSCRLAGMSAATWKYYRKSDADFAEKADLIRARQAGGKKVDANIGFEEFREKYLLTKSFNHQLQWIDVIEGREPRNLHPSQNYHRGDPDTVIINTPPGHAKSTTITMDYVTYKIVTNPEFRVVIISKTETMAKKFLVGIKRRLTSAQFARLQIDFAPEAGFESSSEVWTSKMIYFGHGESDQKDPNVEVLGIGQQIYGARADLIILDDVQDLNNAAQYAAHMDYVMQDVMTRDAPLVVVGTRVAPVDLYSELLNPEHYDGEESDWTYLSQPAILEPADDPKDWVTLWPRTDRPHSRNPGTPDENGLWPKWDGPRLAALRRKIKPSTWALVYQQQPTTLDATFTIEAIHAVQENRARKSPVKCSQPYNIAGLDPATSAGFTACVALTVDRDNGKRHLVDVFNQQVRAEGLRALIADWTERYNIHEWRIERNAFQAFLTQDREINQFLASRGVRLREHTTGSHTHGGTVGKHDPDWGVASLDSLFRGWEDGTALLTLPGLNPNEAYRQFKEQLVTWYPNAPKTQKTDLVMAFWFAELGAREATRHLNIRRQEYLDNPFLSENDLAGRVVINIDEYLREQYDSRTVM